MKLNIERIKSNLLQIGNISNNGNKGYTRLAYSKEEQTALRWLLNKLKENNISSFQDNIGNVFGRIGNPDEKAILVGSHLDTVPQGGLYDGALGVVAGLECLICLKEHKVDFEIPIELVAFVGEEANALGGTFGSRAFARNIPEDIRGKLDNLPFNYDDILSVSKNRKKYHAFLELHIEQGALLEETNKKIGIVSSIAGIIRLRVNISGKASHSGTTPMELRNDALIHASKLIIKVNKIVKSIDGNNVATVGEIECFPNLANVIPGNVRLTIEIRGSHWDEMKMIEKEIRNFIQNTMDASISISVEKKPNKLSNRIKNEIEDICRIHNIPYNVMVSGANHDANSLVSLMDVGMIFVPSKDGLSHHPEEFTSWQDIEIGANTLLMTLEKLATSYLPAK